MNCTHNPIPTVKSPFHFVLSPNFKSLIHPTATRILNFPPKHPNRLPLLSYCSKSPNFRFISKKRNFEVKASIGSNNGEAGNWVRWLPTGGLAADKVLRLISTATSSPICQFISSPTTFLHSVDPRIKLVFFLYDLCLNLACYWENIERICVNFVVKLFPSILDTNLDNAGLGTDGVPQLLQSRTPPSSLTGLPDLPKSLSGYSYLIMKLGPLQFTRKGLSVASTASCLTFIIFQSASLCLATTTPEQLAFGLRWFMLPLSYIGVPVAEIVLTLMLSLRFINLVFDEVRNVALGIVSRRINWQHLTMKETIDVTLDKGALFLPYPLLISCIPHLLFLWALIPVFASYIQRIFKNIFKHAEQISQAMIVRGFRGDSNAHKLYFLSDSSIGMADLIAVVCLIGVTSAALLSEYLLV
ncbi:hypothetical protein CXB51_022824 [Gossypium anomalum]|uniref:Protein ABCI12, chloroplastic n=1 Tax=Gossypium anomalum TaxID=47600 RepID=A0A8J6CTT8_9ROSI|nr:hypothetical protein CXB51_022824 [Gossypium anomalum]